MILEGVLLWFFRRFKVLSLNKCSKLGLSHYNNLYGPENDNCNYRSIWVDYKGRFYKCNTLFEYKSFEEWYSELRKLSSLIYGVEYTLQIFSLTYSEKYKIYYNKGLSPIKPINKLFK